MAVCLCWINNLYNFFTHKSSQLVSLSSKKSKNNSIPRDCRRNRGEHARKYYVNSSNFMLSEFIIITNTTILLSLDVYWNKFINFSSQINLMIFLSRRRFDQSYESSISLSPSYHSYFFFSRYLYCLAIYSDFNIKNEKCASENYDSQIILFRFCIVVEKRYLRNFLISTDKDTALKGEKMSIKFFKIDSIID